MLLLALFCFYARLSEQCLLRFLGVFHPIGRILPDSPAERCGLLRLGDRILEVDSVDIGKLHHEEIVTLIKDSGFSVTLLIGQPIGMLL